MFSVSGFSMRPRLWILLEDSVHRLWIDIAVEISIHGHRRSVITRTEADDGQQREAAVGRRLPHWNAQAAAELLAQPFVSHDPAAHAVAHQYGMPTHGTAEDQV